MRSRATHGIIVVSACACALLMVAGLRATDSGARGATTEEGYVGKGSLVMRVPLAGTATPVDVGAHIAFEERAMLIRLDVLDVALPGAGAVGNALATQLFPAGGVTVVVDQAVKRYTVWSTATRKYYTSDLAPTAHPTPMPSSGPSAAANPFGFEKSLRDLTALNIAISLAGHSTVDGHRATGLNYQFARTALNGDRTEAHGTVEFADDLDGVPVQLTVSFMNKYIPNLSLRADATQLTRQLPPRTDFAVPTGYQRAASIGDVVGRQLPT